MTDQEQESNDFYGTDQPNWRFSLWDIAAIGISYVGSIAGSIGSIGLNLNQACNMISREFGAAANYSRQTFDLKEAHRLNEEARRQMSEGLERLISGPSDRDLS